MTRKSKKAAPAAEFIKISANGKELPLSAKAWAAAKHVATGIIFNAELLPEATQEEQIAACKKLVLAGAKDWRLAGLKDITVAADFTKREPAFDTRFFRFPKTGLVWTSTTVAGNPGWAWFVCLCHGHSGNAHRDDRRLALAVRGPVPFAGQ